MARKLSNADCTEYVKKLIDDCLEVDNNAAEGEIKTFVIWRKNFLFVNPSKA